MPRQISYQQRRRAMNDPAFAATLAQNLSRQKDYEARMAGQMSRRPIGNALAGVDAPSMDQQSAEYDRQANIMATRSGMEHRALQQADIARRGAALGVLPEHVQQAETALAGQQAAVKQAEADAYATEMDAKSGLIRAKSPVKEARINRRTKRDQDAAAIALEQERGKNRQAELTALGKNEGEIAEREARERTLTQLREAEKKRIAESDAKTRSQIGETIKLVDDLLKKADNGDKLSEDEQRTLQHGMLIRRQFAGVEQPLPAPADENEAAQLLHNVLYAMPDGKIKRWDSGSKSFKDV